MFEENEISIKANGGTELSKRKLNSLITDKSLLGQFQIISSRVRELDESKIRILWVHDLPGDPELAGLANSSFRDKFHKIVFVSNWQKDAFHQMLGMPLDDKICVIENPVDPLNIDYKLKNNNGKINLIYFSTPHRGLDIAYHAVDRISKKHPEIMFHVYSSFKIYGWEENDAPFAALFNSISTHPNMTYYGSVDNDTLRKSLQSMHILAYPNTWQETSCRVLIESMSAGLLCVHPNYAALPETSGGLTHMYQYNQDKNKHLDAFTEELDFVVNLCKNSYDQEQVKNFINFTKTWVDFRYNSNTIAAKWNNLLQDLLVKHVDIESRKYKEIFRYSST